MPTSPTPPNAITLQGQPLRDFIASLHDLWWEPKEWDALEAQRAERQQPWGKPPVPHPSGIPLEQRRSDLITRVHQYRFVPQTPNELERLYYFMADLGMYEAYTLLLEPEHRTSGAFTLLSVIDDAFERAVWELKLDFCVVDALYNFVKNRGKCGGFLKHVVFKKIIALPAPQTRNQVWHLYSLWGRVSSWALQIGDKPLFDRAKQEQCLINHRHSLEKPRWPDTVSSHIAQASFAQHWKRDGDLLHHVNEAITHMVQAQASESQWDSLFSHILILSPVQIPLALRAYEKYLEHTEQNPPAQMLRAEREVLAVRWQARAKAAQGQLDDAISWARRGHFELHRDAHCDGFGRDVLDWLVKANRMDEAAELALQSLLHNCRSMHHSAFQWAWNLHTTDNNPQRRIVWTLTLLWARHTPKLVQYAKEENLEIQSIESYLRRLEKANANHPAFYITQNYFRGMYGACLMDIQRQKKVWPQLESSVLAAPEFTNTEILLTLWCSRFMCCEEKTIRKLPIPRAPNASVCFAVAWQLEQSTYRYCPQRYWQAHATLRKELAQNYYEQGWLKFISFPSHDSHCMDGNREIHATLCNNLGNLYRLQKRYPLAIERCKEGIASWPHAQLYANLLCCFHDLKDWASTSQAAEGHWQTVQTHGYKGSRHYYNPARYAFKIAHALYRTGRTNNICLWLDRLDQWWQQRDNLPKKDKNKTRRGDYLNALTALLSFYSIDHPYEAESLLRTHLAEIECLKKKHAGEKSHGCCKRYAAVVLQHCAQASGDEKTWHQAAYFFRLALSSLAPNETEGIDFCRKGLTKCSAAGCIV